MSALRLGRALEEAAVSLAEAMAGGDPTAIAAALQARERAFLAFCDAAPSPLGEPVRALVEGVLELDREVQAQARARLVAIRQELDQLAQARRLVGRQQPPERPRLVSRRA